MGGDTNDSILKDIKRMLGLPIEDSYTIFDTDIIVSINTAFDTLHQLGVGPKEQPFSISTSENKWHDFMENIDSYGMIKNYILLKVRLLFDPPLSNAVMENMKEQVKEMESRLNYEFDNYG